MVGLDKIINQIKEESREATERTRAETRSRVDEILAQARVDAQREYVDVERRFKQAVANVLERGRTTTELKKRGAALTGKQRFIGAATGMAKAELKGPETGVYFDMVLKLAVKSIQPGESELLPSKRDLERLSEDFEDRSGTSLKGRGAVLHISGDTRDISGGFVLTHGGIEENCSIDVLFDTAHEVLQDRVQEILFP